MCKGCPLSWTSQLQTGIFISSIESEYTVLSHALREVIPNIQVMQEMKHPTFLIRTAKPKTTCKVFEDNRDAIEMAKHHKVRRM